MNTESQRNLFAALFAFFMLASLALIVDGLVTRAYAQELNQENERMDQELFQAQEDVEAERQKVYSLQDELEGTEAELAQSRAALSQCNESLALLAEEYANCTRENYLLTTSLSETGEEVEYLVEELENFEEQIAISMEWFTENSNTDSMATSIKRQVHDCSQGEEINLACIPAVMEQELGWSYHVEPRDRLLSFSEMAREEGGDCEDWSLFFKGSINYLRQRGGGKQQDLVAWQPGVGTFDIYNGWYYDSAVPKKVGTIDNYAYVVCYDSHCAVAISPHEIRNSSEIGLLEGAPVVESQNGKYLFTIGDGFGHDLCGIASCDPDDIFIVIGDNDIYEHYNVGWLGYADFLQMSADYHVVLEEYMQLIEGKLTQ